MKYLIFNPFFFLSIFTIAADNFSIVPDLKSMSKEEITTLKPRSAQFTDPEILGIENFSVEKKNGKMHIGFDLLIKNSNRIGLVIKPSSLFLTLAGQDIGWVRVEEKIKIKRKSEAGYPFMLVGNSGDFGKSAFSSIWSIIIGKGIDFNIKGTIRAGVFFFKKKWKIDFTYEITNDEFRSLF